MFDLRRLRLIFLTQSDGGIMSTKKPYETPALTKHQRLQKVTLGTATPPPPGPDWLMPGQ